MRIYTLLDARRAIANYERVLALPPEQFTIAREDWYAILATLGGGDPVELQEPKICGIPVVVTD